MATKTAMMWVMGAVLACVLAPSRPLHADERPWARDVSEEQQSRARALFEAANADMERAEIAAAIRSYRQAIEIWDHPMIRYNLAVALIASERPVEAYQQLTGALRFGAEPLEKDRYEQALRDRRALQARLVHLTVRSDEPGVAVRVDGRPILAESPGRGALLLRPGERQLVVRQGRAPALLMSLPLWPDRHYTVTVTPSAARHRRWPAWQPWAVLGSGAAVAVLGAPLEGSARTYFDRFDAAVAQACPLGCREEDVPAAALALEGSGTWRHRVALGAFALGAGAAATGLLMMALNRERRIDRDAFQVSFQPLLGGLGASGRY
jgi:hypothetical protein